jgi:hypothetical protein
VTGKNGTKLVGANVDGWCTRCKLVLAHTIEAMAGDKITRVHCNSCGGQHAHRKTAPGTRAAGAAKGRADALLKEEARRPSSYEALLRGRTAAGARPYSQTGRFKVGELISHATFGLGAITVERDHVKIEVLFPEGPKVLLHGQ